MGLLWKKLKKRKGVSLFTGPVRKLFKESVRQGDPLSPKFLSQGGVPQ